MRAREFRLSPALKNLLVYTPRPVPRTAVGAARRKPNMENNTSPQRGSQTTKNRKADKRESRETDLHLI